MFSNLDAVIAMNSAFFSKSLLLLLLWGVFPCQFVAEYFFDLSQLLFASGWKNCKSRPKASPSTDSAKLFWFENPKEINIKICFCFFFTLTWLFATLPLTEPIWKCWSQRLRVVLRRPARRGWFLPEEGEFYGFSLTKQNKQTNKRRVCNEMLTHTSHTHLKFRLNPIRALEAWWRRSRIRLNVRAWNFLVSSQGEQ